MLLGEPVAKFDQLTPCAAHGCWRVNAVMEVNFYFAPAVMAMFGKLLNQGMVVLFRGIEIGMNKRLAVVIPPLLGSLRIVPTPGFQTPFLLVIWSSGSSILGHDSRFEVIGQRNDHEDGTVSVAAMRKSASSAGRIFY